MDGKCFIDTAQFLHSRGSAEADFRSAVSRAYYACFLAARGIAYKNCSREMRLAVGMHKESGLRHEKLQQYLKAGLAEPVRRLGENLAGLCGLRNDADYNMSARFDAGDAKQCIDDAQAFLAALAAVDPQEVGKALDTNIRKTHTHP